MKLNRRSFLKKASTLTPAAALLVSVYAAPELSGPSVNPPVPIFNAFEPANVALALNRKLHYDLKKHEFVNDTEANRLRSEALREPWRI